MEPKRPSYETLQKMIAKLENELADRRDIERELAHLASYSEMAPSPIVEADIHGQIHYINPAALQEFPELEAAGFEHPVLKDLLPILQTLQRDGKSLVTRPIKINEKIYDQQISILDDGPRVRLYFRDITELKRLDQLKTDFVNMVSHELRSPLTTINASIRMLAAEQLGAITSDQKEALKMAQNNIDRLGRLINELLDISKIEAGKLELRCESVDMGQLITEIVRNFEPLARERGLDLRMVIPAEPLELFIDRDKIVQVFTNLIQNALKFTEKGYVVISASLDAQGMRCQVSDSGHGIESKDLPKVFGKFQQFGHAPKGREKGTGLGLSLCKGFVELHGGRIWVESRLGAGTQMIFVLPSLAAESLFNEEVRHLFEDAVSHSQPLTLVSFGIEQWKLLLANNGREMPAILLYRLQAVVKSALGVESVTVIQGRGAVWLALPEIAKAAAQEMARRVRRDAETSLAAAMDMPAAGLEVKIASYPEDANLPEELLQRLAA